HLLDETSHVQQAAGQLRNPLLEKLKATIQEGRDAVNQSTATGASQTDAARRHLDDLTAQFKQLSDATLPLTQEIILLRQCKSSLQAWRSSIRKEYTGVLESLLVRVFAILIGLALVLLLSSLWRRATFRYVHEARRRRQLLALRRAVTGFLMAVVIILGFVSEFSSLATYAGLLTAGVAVALQAVILSVAAYFFLIGRYGVRIGDRITVAGVTGDVVDIGLVRLYLMELAGTGIDLYPTGRLVAFSNSVLFQTTTPLFKQIPGTAYAWHEVAAKLAAGASYSSAEDKVLEVVNSVYVQYKGGARARPLFGRAPHGLSNPGAQPTRAIAVR
ncbi:MAG: mechanosensitive ion channel domain-containing protein, partial [Terriglobia bacterium]